MKNAIFFLLALGLLATAGYVVHQRELERVAGLADFHRLRAAVLEAENKRLIALYGEKARESANSANEQERVGIMEAVGSLRELEFLQEVDFRQLTRDDLPGLIASKIDEQFTADELAAMQEMYAAIGLLPEGFDLKQAYVDLFAEQIAAFYDQHADALFMFDGKDLDDAMNRMIFAHELVHALQDQHYRLEEMPLELKTNDDRMLAASALVEGDATLLMSLFFAQDISAEDFLPAIVSSVFTQSLAQLGSAPPFLRESLLFPYIKGQEFATALYDHGGMEAISGAFERVPVSTRQILHPDEYLDNPEFAPIAVDWSDAEGEADVLGVNVLGEFGIGVLLAQWIDRAKAEAAARGWIGDGYRVLRTADGVATELESWWESEDDAREFAEAYAMALAARYGIEGEWNSEKTQWSATGAGRQVALTRESEFVGLRDRSAPSE